MFVLGGTAILIFEFAFLTDDFVYFGTMQRLGVGVGVVTVGVRVGV
jgi:hypothetical protein